jgi:hypothetical protein
MKDGFSAGSPTIATNAGNKMSSLHKAAARVRTTGTTAHEENKTLEWIL